MNITLTREQSDIFNNLKDFLSSEDNREILLIGYAGTGKTTLVTKFISHIIKNNIIKRMVITAPTHKALNILKSKIYDNFNDIIDIYNYLNLMTIHRLLNYQSYINHDGVKYFAKGKVDANWSIYELIVIDECSMLTNQIIKDIQLQLSKNQKVKIIYMGDPAQLPPINQNESKIFNSKIKKLYLDKIIRTSNYNIMQLSNSHRNWIFSQKDNDIPKLFNYLCDKISIFSSTDEQSKKIWLDKFINILNNNVDNNVDNIIINNINNSIKNTDKDNENDKKIISDDSYNNNIILTWTNNKCDIYNKYIRHKLFNKEKLNDYEIGEVLIFNDFYKIIIDDDTINDNNNDNNDNNNNDNITNSHEDSDLNKFYKNIKNNKNNNQKTINFYTSEQIKLIEIEKNKYIFNNFEYKVNNNLPVKINLIFKKFYNKLNDVLKNINLKIYKMKIKKIKNILNKNIDENILYNIITICPKYLLSYNNCINEIETIINELKNKLYQFIDKSDFSNKVKCNLQSEIELKINKVYKEFLINVVDCFAHLNYGYCITVHKSQGSTFKNVFIDMNDILTNNNFPETLKCLYTAITRASDNINLLI